jgi:hypothetical protein
MTSIFSMLTCMLDAKEQDSYARKYKEGIPTGKDAFKTCIIWVLFQRDWVTRQKWTDLGLKTAVGKYYNF